MPADAPELDGAGLQRYLDRIGYVGAVDPTPAVLRGLHLAHATRIPFENLDILLGRPIRLDLASLQSKLVDGRRGGYCFEHNLLFAAVLRTLGFRLTPLAARVRYRATAVLPRTHMLLLVHCADTDWIADTGFGGEGLLQPVAFAPMRETRQYAWTYRVGGASGERTLQSRHGADWVDLYSFTLEPQLLADYELANYYMSTHPDSRFTRTLTVQLPGTRMRAVLRGMEMTEDDGHHVKTTILSDEAQRLEVLAGRFGLHFPPGTRFATGHPGAEH
jgi:N-hydroxyarylamine O-acetyltransferase